jgi:hypothetical protein
MVDDGIVVIYSVVHLWKESGLYEPGGCFGGWGPKMCKTRVWGVLGGIGGFRGYRGF